MSGTVGSTPASHVEETMRPRWTHQRPHDGDRADSWMCPGFPQSRADAGFTMVPAGGTDFREGRGRLKPARLGSVTSPQRGARRHTRFKSAPLAMAVPTPCPQEGLEASWAAHSDVDQNGWFRTSCPTRTKMCVKTDHRFKAFPRVHLRHRSHMFKITQQAEHTASY